MPSKLAVDLELELRPLNPDPAQEFKETLVFHLSLACTPLSMLVEQFGKGHVGKGCSVLGRGHSVPISPQGNSVLGKQLQEEAQGLRTLYQEKVLPQQSLVVSLEAQGAWGLWGRGGRQGA